MALTKEVVELLLNQQKDFMQEQRMLREKELQEQKQERGQDMMELKELISKANDEVKEKVEKLDDKQTKALKVVANDVGEIKERQDEEVEARAAMEVRMKTLEDELKRVKDMNSKEKESRASSTEILNVNGECVDNTSEAITDILKNATKVIGLAPIN